MEVPSTSSAAAIISVSTVSSSSTLPKSRSMPPLEYYVDNPIYVMEAMGYHGVEPTGEIAFIAGKQREKLCGFKSLLGKKSSVFRLLLSDPNVKEIDHPECEPQIIRLFLKFIQTDTLSSYISNEQLLHLLRLSVKYRINNLGQACCDIAGMKINIQNCVSFHEAGILYDREDLQRMAFFFMLRNSEEFLNSPYFLKLNESLLYQLICSDRFMVTEIQLFRRLWLWADEECSPKWNPNWYTYMKMSCLIKHIRFALMSPHDFVGEIIPKGVLSKKQIIEVKDRYKTPHHLWCSLSPSEFVERPRLPTQTISVPLYQLAGAYTGDNGWRRPGVNIIHCQSVRLLLSQDISLVAVGFYGPYDKNFIMRSGGAPLHPYSYDVDISLKNDFASNYWTFAKQSARKLATDDYVIELDYPIKMTNQEPYTLSIRLQGLVAQCGIRPFPQAAIVRNDRVDCPDVIIHFADTDSPFVPDQTEMGNQNVCRSITTKGIIRALHFITS